MCGTRAAPTAKAVQCSTEKRCVVVVQMHWLRVGPARNMFYVGGEKTHHSHHLAAAIPEVLFQLSMFGMVASGFHDPRLQSILKCNVDIRDQYLQHSFIGPNRGGLSGGLGSGAAELDALHYFLTVICMH